LNKQLVDSISNLSPLVANKVLESLTPNEIRGIVGLKPESGGSDLDPELLSSQSNPLIELGEDESKDWLLIDEFEVDYDTDEKENDILNGEVKQSLLSKVVNLVSTGSAFPNSKSEQDANIEGIKFITRYVYDGRATEKTRPFCAQMVRANKIYRKEDILRMGNNVVNAGWGPRGADTYSIWLYKGGGNCHHRWLKRVYASFEGIGIDVNSPRATQVAVKKAEKLGYVIKNPVLVGRRPIDMENRGFLPKD
jgi:hypothetical protein